MAKAKYTKGADGYFTTKTWDGSYNQDGTKHRVTLRSKKSSADLEKQVIELKAKIRNGDAIRGSDMLFCEYAAEWLETYKAVRTQTRGKCTSILSRITFLFWKGSGSRTSVSCTSNAYQLRD